MQNVDLSVNVSGLTPEQLDELALSYHTVAISHHRQGDNANAFVNMAKAIKVQRVIHMYKPEFKLY